MMKYAVSRANPIPLIPKMIGPAERNGATYSYMHEFERSVVTEPERV